MHRASGILALTLVAGAAVAAAQNSPAWPQWGQNPQHTGNLPVAGQAPQAKLSDTVFDPFVAQETAESGGALLLHYQVPLINGSTIFMEQKEGSYVSCQPPGSGQPFPCGPDAWNTEIWRERALRWQNGQLLQVWHFATDWVPVPNSGTTPSNRSLRGWEMLFQPALSGKYIYVPGAGGTIYKLKQSNGSLVSRINPFGSVDPSKFVVGGLTADSSGNVYYNVMQVVLSWPWDEDVVNAWLVKVAPDNSITTATYASLVPGAPSECLGTFSASPYPWPPSAGAVPPNVRCGSQRSALNLAPAISADGSTLYTVSRGHFWPRNAYLIAVNAANLSPLWSTSLHGLLSDGCNVLLPPDGQPGGCSIYGATGIDPTQNTLGGGIVNDTESASPVVTPDGSILIGANSGYNSGRGHLLKFDPQGQFLASYDFGWDSTPTIYSHGGTYSVVIKDNHYDQGSYCSDPIWCPRPPKGPYYITQLDANLDIEWQFQDTSTDKGHPNGFEWCVNDAVVDANGAVYADDEDGYLYVIPQGGAPTQKLFLEQSLDAGYTPVSMGGDGMIYAQNAGHLIAVGELFATSTQVTSSQNPATYGNSVTFTATVASNAGIPTGSVTFKKGTAVLGKALLTNASATYTTTPTQLPAGNDRITAVYRGNSTHAASTSPVLTEVVKKTPTSTALSAQPNPSSVGQRVKLTATVTASPGIPTGSVTFWKGTTMLGTVALTNGTATLDHTFTTARTLKLSAVYAGSGNYHSSSGSVVQTVQ
ncbi:MAG: Ig-like domain-containing protein [Terriglobales bacterium]